MKRNPTSCSKCTAKAHYYMSILLESGESINIQYCQYHRPKVVNWGNMEGLPCGEFDLTKLFATKEGKNECNLETA